MWKDFVLGDGSKAVKQVDIDGKTVFKKQSYVDTEFTSSLAPTSWTEVTKGTEYTASNDWGEWRITADSYGGGNDYYVKYAFNNSASTSWEPASASDTDYSWISIILPQGTSISPKQFSITASYLANKSNKAEFQGYIDGTWETLAKLQGVNLNNYLINVSTDKFYAQFRLYTTSFGSFYRVHIYDFKITSGTIRKAVS